MKTEDMLQYASGKDLAAICALLAESGLPFEDLSPSAVEQFWLARSGEMICGVVGLEQYGEHALLRSLAVAKRCQRQGWGSRLVTNLEGAAAASGVRALYLLTTTARDFFAVRGYQAINRHEAPEAVRSSQEFASLCPESAVCMVKKLV